MTKNDFFDAIKIVIIFNDANVCIEFMTYHNWFLIGHKT